MTSISLRAYHRQIDGWIDKGLYDQAIAHCRHILMFYPKCLETYRLLGKAFLESQKFGDANDIFQRILSSLPDDFISHVGMSIIREDESNLNEAIWHMERAFEIQPSNNAIQGELRRLYGRRDGFEPPKVNLNRSALARMYLKGNLNSQAIAEIRMALAEDPQRPDLEVLLAKAYFESKQIPEAREIANQILVKLPYCYDAIFLLWQISLLEGKEKDAEKHLAKLAELDPYAGYINKDIPTPDQVVDTAILLDKLEIIPSQAAQATSQQPEWAASLGIQINTEEEMQGETSLPDWIKDETSPPETVSELNEQELENLIEPADAIHETTTATEIPDWMRELGWEEGQGVESEKESNTISPFTESEELQVLEASEIPDWLKEISPVNESDLSSFDTGSLESLPYMEEIPPSEGDSLATWLAGIEDEIENLEKTSPPSLEDVPEWVNELNNKSGLTIENLESPSDWSELETQEKDISKTSFPTSETTEFLQTTSSPNEDLQAWLTTEEPIQSTEHLPDWLNASYDEKNQLSIMEPAISEEDTKPVRVQPKEILPAEQPAGIDQTLSAPADDEGLSWLESLAAKQGDQEPHMLSPEESKEQPPEWIREYLDSKPDLVESEPSVEMESPLSDSSQFPIPETPEQIAGFDLTPEVSEELKSDELPEWLRAELELKKQLNSAAPPSSESEIPDWLVSIAQEENIEWVQEFPTEETAVISSDETISIETTPTVEDSQFQEKSEAEESPLSEMEQPQEDLFETSLNQLEEITLPLEETQESIGPQSEDLFQLDMSGGEGEEYTKSITEEIEKVSIPPDREETIHIDTQLVDQEAVKLHQIEMDSQSVVYAEGVGDSQYEIVEEARLALANGMFDQAIEKYQNLIKQRFGLDQIIQDLSNALYQNPMEVRMWILLGDAYLRKDHLSEALEAYNKAEELLR